VSASNQQSIESRKFIRAQVSLGFAGDPVIVEFGSFLGSSSLLPAHARRARGSGRHMIHLLVLGELFKRFIDTWQVMRLT
jgi:hypothetical protein